MGKHKDSGRVDLLHGVDHVRSAVEAERTIIRAMSLPFQVLISTPRSIRGPCLDKIEI